MVAKTQPKHLSATVVIRDDRHPELAITWKVGGRLIVLTHQAGADEVATIIRKSYLKGDVITAELAEQEAKAWFDSMDVFDDEEEVEGDEWID
jgi:hypothetical protein